MRTVAITAVCAVAVFAQPTKWNADEYVRRDKNGMVSLGAIVFGITNHTGGNLDVASGTAYISCTK